MTDSNAAPLLTRAALRKIERDNSQAASGLGRRRLIIIVPLLLFISLAGWALSSPIGSSPDDDFHLASTWCGLGDRPGLCEPSDLKNARKVPNTILDTWNANGSPHGNLYCFLNGVSPACQNEWLRTAKGEMRDTGRINFGSGAQYTNFYYSAMGLFASDNVRLSVLSIRLVNALVFTILSALLYLALPKPRRVAFVLTWSLALVPVAMFFIPSTNPSSWAFIGVPSTFFAMLSFFETQGKRKIFLGIIASVAVLLSSFARSDAAIYAVLAIVFSGVLQAKEIKKAWSQIIFPAALSFVSLAVFFLYPLNVLLRGLPTDSAYKGGVAAFINNLIFIPSSLLPNAFAPQSLGWLDVPLYPPAYVFVSLAVLIIAGFAISFGGFRKLLVIILTLIALIVAPLYVAQLAGVNADRLLQARYIAPLAIVLIAVLLYTNFGEVFQIKRRYLAVIYLAIVPANAFAIFSLLRHYDALPSFFGGGRLASGMSGPRTGGDAADATGTAAISHATTAQASAAQVAEAPGVIHDAWWWPNLSISPALVFVVTSAVFALALFVALRDVLKIRNEVNVENETQKALSRGRRARGIDAPALVNVGTGMITLNKISNATSSIPIHEQSTTSQIPNAAYPPNR